MEVLNISENDDIKKFKDRKNVSSPSAISVYSMLIVNLEAIFSTFIVFLLITANSTLLSLPK